MLARRLLTALLLALVVSGSLTFVLARKLSKPHVANLRYVTAVRDLDVGEVLKEEDLRMMDWPTSAKISGALSLPADAVGRAVLSPLASGQPIVAKQLSAVGGVGLSAKIPQGMRAISLRSDQVVGVAGFLLPGTHIDVLVTYKNPSQTDAVTATVLQNAEVLAAGQKTEADPEGKPSMVDVVTLLVSPHAAEQVALASTQGTVHFVLRNGADQKQTEPGITDVAALGLMPSAAPFNEGVTSHLADARVPVHHLKSKPEPQAQPYRVLVVRGDKQTEETVE